MPFDSQVIADVAFCVATAAGMQAGPPATFVIAEGITAALRNGAGDYSLTIDPANLIGPADMLQATVNGASALEIAVEPVSASSVRVRILNNAGAATDAGFSLVIRRPTDTFGAGV